MADYKNNVIPFPGTKRPIETESRPSDFRDFIHAVTSGDQEMATMVLQSILAVDLDLAQRSAMWFVQKFRANAGFIQEAMKLRFILAADKPNDGIVAIYDVFGLQGPEALMVYEKLRMIMGATQEASS